MKNKKIRVLIVDDDLVMHNLLSNVLNNGSFEIVGSAHTAEQAEILVKKNKPDILLMDIQLGTGMNGIQLAKKIISYYPVPVILNSGYVESEFLDEAVKDELFEFVSKTSGMEVLKATMIAKYHWYKSNIGEHKYKQLFRGFTEQSVLGFMVGNIVNSENDKSDLRITEGNQAFCAMIDVELDACKNNLLSDIVSAQPSLSNIIYKIKEEGSFRSRVELLTKKNNQKKTVDVEIILFDTKGVAGSYVICLLYDVTRQIEDQEQLNLVSHAIKQIQESIIITDGKLQKPHPLIIYVNDAAVRMTGFSKEELIGNSPRLFQGKKTDRKLLQKLKKELRAGEVFTGKTVNYRKNKQEYTVNWDVHPFYDKETGERYFISIQKDITAEEKVRSINEANRRLLNLIFMESNEGKLFVAPDKTVLLCNDHASDIIRKLTNINIIETNEIYVEDTDQLSMLLVNGIDYALLHKEIHKVDYHATKNEISYSFELTFIPVLKKDEADGVVVSLYDVSRLKKSERELRELNTQLEEKVKERTRTHILARKEAEKNAKIKEEFLANMSHEIRTPISGIKGVSELLKNTKLNTEQQEYADILESLTKSLSTIVDDILQIGKMQDGKFSLVHEPFDFKNLLDTVVFIARQRSTETGIAFELVNNLKEYCYLLGDVTRIKQVLLNIIDNAFKYTESGKVTLKINGNRLDDEYNFTISIIDTGTGLKPEDQQKIFEPFVQVESSMTRSYGGSGLGLSIAQNVIRRMNGDISLKSEFGKGSEFIISFSLPEIDKQIIPDGKFSANHEMKLAGLRLLLVDDNQMNLNIQSKNLKMAGADVEVADTGLDAIELVKSLQFDLILLDIHMPHMDGYDVVKTLKKENLLNCPVLALTADVFLNQDTLIDLGFYGLLQKPFKIEELEQRLFSIALMKEKKNGEAVSLVDSNGKLYDVIFIEELSNGDIDFYNKVLGNFVEAAHTAISDLKKYPENLTDNELYKTVHTIKPNMQYLNMPSLKLCDKIKQTVRTQENADLRAEVESLISKLQQTANEVETKIK